MDTKKDQATCKEKKRCMINTSIFYTQIIKDTPLFYFIFLFFAKQRSPPKAVTLIYSHFHTFTGMYWMEFINKCAYIIKTIMFFSIQVKVQN